MASSLENKQHIKDTLCKDITRIMSPIATRLEEFMGSFDIQYEKC